MELQRVIDMEKISIALSSRTVDVAEHKNYYELVDRVAFMMRQTRTASDCRMMKAHLRKHRHW